jgi:hypothetical protein
MGKKKREKEESALEMKAKILEIETKKRDEEIVIIEAPELEMEFGTWFHSRTSKIPAIHLKEIIWADFKARGLKNKELAYVYDEALKVYGIK